MSDRDREDWTLDSKGGSRASESTSDGKGWRDRDRAGDRSDREMIARILKGEKWSGRRG